MTEYVNDQAAAEWQHVQDVQRTFSSDYGARVLARLTRDFCGMSFVESSPRQTDFREGQRHVIAVLHTRMAMTLPDVLDATTLTADTDHDQGDLHAT